MKTTPENVFDKLVGGAFYRAFAIGSPDGQRTQRAIQRGEELPEVCRPGYMIKMLPEAEREALKGLTADMTNHRVCK